MSKFHINKHGVPAPCKAKPGNCPYGGSESHFNTIEEAQEYANRLHAEEFGVLGGVDNNGHTKKYTERDVISEARELLNTIDTRIKKVREPKLSRGPGSIKSDYDLDTLIELYSQYVTTDEHDPVKNVQSMFDYVAGKSGKLYRYNDKDNPYLENHGYNFYMEIRNLERYLEKEGYFDEYYGYGEKGRKDFERNVADHEELHDYTRSLAVEYGKDFEKEVVLSGKYSFEEQDKIQAEYRRALADKIRRFLAD